MGSFVASPLLAALTIGFPHAQLRTTPYTMTVAAGGVERMAWAAERLATSAVKHDEKIDAGQVGQRLPRASILGVSRCGCPVARSRGYLI